MSLSVGSSAGHLSVWGNDENIEVTSDGGTFNSIEEAEEAAREIADSDYEDALIVEEDGAYHVYGVEEIRDKFGGGWSNNKIYDAPANSVEFIMTDARDDETERVAGTSDRSTQVDELTRALDRSGLSFSEAYNIVKHGVTAEQAEDLIDRFETFINENSGGLQGANVAQARHLQRLFESVVELANQQEGRVSAGQMAELFYVGDAVSGARWR